LLKLNMQEHGEILELFATEKFIETNNDNYADLEQVGRSLGLIQ
jgi:phosphonate transport system substrate-binding protein